MPRSVTVFARPPCPGRVKTRLSPALPGQLAARLARGMLEDALAAAARCRGDGRRLAWAEPLDAPAEVRVPAGFETTVQRGADLGERLQRELDGRLATAGAAIVIGADCPELDEALLDEAFVRLEERDLVLGPTTDGGYYLIGLGRRAPGLLDGIAWSTGAVRRQTLERAAQLGLTAAELPPLADLDTPADLVALVARWLERGPPSSATAAALVEIGLLPRA